MSAYFNTSDRQAWAKLLIESFRLNNPKVIDKRPLGRAAAKAGRAHFPIGYQGVPGNPFSRLVRAAETVKMGDGITRQLVIDRAWEALRALMAVNHCSDATRMMLVDLLVTRGDGWAEQLDNVCVTGALRAIGQDPTATRPRPYRADIEG